MDFRGDAGIVSAIGNTPLVRLKRVFPDISFRFFAKMEALNPGGSMKDRAANNMISRAIASGAIREGTVIVESSSGNMGIGLAQACRFYGLKFICVVDPKTTPQNVRLLDIYGATVDMVAKPDPVSGEFLVARLNRVRELMEIHVNAFWPNQYANPNNAAAHYATMDEIVAELEGYPDYLFCAVSTCGTLRGCSMYLRERNVPTTIVAVDAVGSIIFGGPAGKRLIPGHGAAVRPGLYAPDMADDAVLVSDPECVAGCRLLAGTEGILAGGSAGAVIAAVSRTKKSFKGDSTCVAILADRGERYLDTIYSDTWVTDKFGHIPELLQESSKPSCVAATP